MPNEPRNLTIADQVLLAMERLRNNGLIIVSRSTLWNYFDAQRMTESKGGKIRARSLSSCITMLIAHGRLQLVCGAVYDVQHFRLPAETPVVIGNESVTTDDEREVNEAAEWLISLRATSHAQERR